MASPFSLPWCRRTGEFVKRHQLKAPPAVQLRGLVGEELDLRGTYRAFGEHVQGLLEQVFELVGFERLEEVMLVPDAKATCPVRRPAESAHRHGVRRLMRTESLHECPAVAVRQADVGKQDLAARVRNSSQRFGDGGCRFDRVAQLLEQEDQQAATVLMVLDDKGGLS